MGRPPARLLALLGLAVTACAPAAASHAASAPRGDGGSVLAAPMRPSLQQAMRTGRDLGPTAPATPLHLEATLAGRDGAALEALVGRGVRVTPGEYAQRFAPDAAAVDAARSLLAAHGISLAWRPGDQLATLDASAAAAHDVFGVSLHDFVAAGGERFHAPTSASVVPVALRSVITGVTGFDDWSQHHVSAIPSPRGVSPKDMESFYDVNGVRSSVDGSGLTIVLPEIDSFDQSDLDAYAAKYDLPSFDVEVHRNSGAWGDPDPPDDEANMDVEIAHAMAPGAKLVVYYSSPKNTDVLPMLQAMFSEQAGPSTIVSSSIGTCESPDQKAAAQQEEDIVRAAAAKGTSIFVASGDRGAYDCTPEGDYDTLAVDLDGSLPDITSVGGTTAFLGRNGGYSREVAWGQPVEQWGGNGGLSTFWQRPSWQAAPGVDNQYSNGMRQTPDVSADADSQSGWNVISRGGEHKIGGTSSAAPFWAGITALLDQVLLQQHHPTIGFANPGLYWMAQNASTLAAPPFHDITVGDNLYYPATAGWDYASGLGSPDVGALAVDWPKYMESQGR
ncbi:MAG TPA: S53 family peptidase [Candidatus Dormibacteraeota bacterium]|nr:S53 family peptidase [Candidatus Dormibacteraeota bacterium]